ncbi:hypothetical protein MTR67_027151 [Solanum verrucosum]|uniref:Uncharacterized protein n=1 Tax=Solanum verrucosum TaxID=315347 RepID=A0AAF0R1T0_SOLVR|nr:hypothetical protein MTR67_027151 [Solanum verrucosum]
MASVLSSDGKQDPDILAANASSAALMLSDIPWGGPIGVIRIGRISGQFVVNPSMEELSISDLNLVYACTRDKTLMIDVQAREISEKDLEAALRLAHPEAVKHLDPQIRLAAKAGKQKKEYKLSMVSEKTFEKIQNLANEPIEAVFTDPTYGKFERGEALEKITQDVKRALKEEGDEEGLKILPKTVDTVRKQVVRRRIISEGLRVDGRRLDEVRPLYCEAGLSSHANMQSCCHSLSLMRCLYRSFALLPLEPPGDAQRLDSLVGPSSKRFMLHYSFPPFCTNEVGKQTGLNRCEVGHGTLAEKALLAVLAPEDDFPYAVRINSEVMASDGSTSMATVCGGSMALMDSGIPLIEHVAGLLMGLVSEVDPSTGEIKDYRLLTDILGLEDHLGDMDFKIAGTRNGVTAIQLDIKPAGIPLDIRCESLDPALKGRLQILGHMEREISAPRIQDDIYSPRLVTSKYSNDALRRLIGPVGALKRKIEDETGAWISVSDGILAIIAKNQSVMEKYRRRVSDVVSVGQQLSLMCIGQDVHGNIKLSLKATLPRRRSKTGISVDAPTSQEVMFGLPLRMYPMSKKTKCDEEEKSDALNWKGDNGSQSASKSEKKTRIPSCFSSRSAKKSKRGKDAILDLISDDESEQKHTPEVGLHSQIGSDKDDATSETPMSANKLKLGMRLTAKVHQIRALGLVLDLGGGIRGMYRFEPGMKSDFEVGD